MNKKLKKYRFAEKIRTVYQEDYKPQYITEAAAVLRQGGTVVIPTTSLYGLGVTAFDSEAVKQLYRIKNRPDANPILILIHCTENMEQYAKRLSEPAIALMKCFWPGNVTLVVEAGPLIPDILCSGSGKIGIRQCFHPITAALIKALGTPITGTSANTSGNPGCSSISALEDVIAEQVQLILDAGELKGGNGSTVVDVTTDPITILREGTIPRHKIFQALSNNC